MNGKEGIATVSHDNCWDINEIELNFRCLRLHYGHKVPPCHSCMVLVPNRT